MSVLLSSGSNAHGQLSNGTVEDSYKFAACSFSGCLSGTLPPGTRRVVHVTSGANHTLALLEMEMKGQKSTQLWGCGDGSSGQLGSVLQNTRVFQPIKLSLDNAGLNNYTYKLVCTSWETTYIALSREGSADVLISMGVDDFGDLGVGGVKNGEGSQPATPFHIVDLNHLLLEGTSLEESSIIVESLASGQHHVVAQIRGTLVNETVVTFVVGWGTSRHGQLGNMIDSRGRPIPFLTKPTVVFVTVNGSQDRIIGLALGSQHTAFLYASGKVSGLGSNRKGQLHGLENIRYVVSLGCTWNGTYFLVNKDQGDTDVMAIGSHIHGQLGRPVDTSRPAELRGPSAVKFPVDGQGVRDLACGTEHVLVIRSPDKTILSLDTAVWGWGWNEHGNLGTGTTTDVFVPTRVWSGAEKNLVPVKVWAGSGTSWIYATYVEPT